MAEQSKIDRIAPDGDDEQGRSTPTTIDLAKAVENRDPNQPNAPAVIETRTETFELQEIPSILLMEMGAIAGGSATGDENQMLVAVWDLLKAALGTTEMRRFKTFAMEVDASTEEIMRWIGEMVGKISARPTKGQSDLPPGLPETQTSSTEPGDSTTETQAAPGSAL